MKSNITKRVEALEARYKIDPMMIEAETESGEVIIVNARELLNNPDLGFHKVVSGTDPKGFDAILDRIRLSAIMECDNVGWDEAKEIMEKENSEFERKCLGH